MKKRYAIVRVDNTWCPNKFENVDNRFVCDSRKKNIKYVHCERCLYGDTKEQMVKKVATAILRTLKDGEVLKYEKFGTGFIKQPVSVEYLAERIVEFLGVE